MRKNSICTAFDKPKILLGRLEYWRMEANAFSRVACFTFERWPSFMEKNEVTDLKYTCRANRWLYVHSYTTFVIMSLPKIFLCVGSKFLVLNCRCLCFAVHMKSTATSKLSVTWRYYLPVPLPIILYVCILVHILIVNFFPFIYTYCLCQA